MLSRDRNHSFTVENSIAISTKVLNLLLSRIK